MRFADAFRDEDFHRLAQELRPGVAEQLFRLCVDDRDVALTVDDHDRIRRRFEQAAELRFARLQLAQPPENRDVTLADGDQRLVISSTHHYADRNQRTFLPPAKSLHRDRASGEGAAQIGRGFAAEFIENRQVGNPPANSFLRREAEHRLCAAIPREYPTVVRHGKECVRRSIEEALRMRNISGRPQVVGHACQRAALLLRLRLGRAKPDGLFVVPYHMSWAEGCVWFESRSNSARALPR